MVLVLSSAGVSELGREKVKFSQGFIVVDGEKWGKTKTLHYGDKYSFSTLLDKEFIVMTYVRAKRVSYLTVKFIGTEIDKFEMSGNRKSLVRDLIESNVIEKDTFSLANAKLFKDKYEEDISSKYKKE